MNEINPSIGHNSRIPVYAPFYDQIKELRQQNEAASFDYEDAKDNRAARSWVATLRKIKTAIDEARKKEKQESLDYGRRVDAEAKDLIGAVQEMIDAHAEPIKEIEEREKARIAGHEKRLAQIAEAGRSVAEHWAGMSLEAMREHLAEVEAHPTGEEHWQEYAPQAAETIDTATAQIRDAIARREKHDEEQAELARLRAAEEARQAAERAKEEEERKAREAEEAKRREKEAAERAERETTARLNREAEERAQAEAKAKARREADEKHRAEVDGQAVAALMKGGLAEESARTAVRLIAGGQVPAVRIAY